MDPLVTIVITSYNYGALVGDAIRSALAQTYRNVEVLVLDNASTDDSLQVIESFSDERLRVIVHPENIGFQRNHNAGIVNARGEFILFLSADDMLLPSLVEDMLEQRRLHPDADVIYASVAILDGKDRIQYYFDQPSFDGAESYWNRNEFASLLTRDNNMYFPTTLFTRAMFDELGLLAENLSVVVDYEWCIRLAGAGKRFAFMAKPGALIRFHGENRSGVKNFVGTGQQLREFCHVLETYTKPEYHHLLAGYHQELRAMVERKILEMRNPFPSQYAALQDELFPLIESARASIATVPPIGEAVLRGEGLISVVLPFRGRLAMLQHALESLKAQDYQNWEAIVVCDNTFDPSGIVEWLGLSDRVRVARLRVHGGPSIARNLGLGCANGEIVCYLDEDNRFAPGYLRAVAVAMADPSTSAVAGHSRFVVIGPGGIELKACTLDSGLLADGTVSTISNRLPLNAVAHRRSCLATAGRFHAGMRALEDWEFLLRLGRGFHIRPLREHACDVRIEALMMDHFVFGRRNSEQWTEYVSRISDIYSAYPPRTEQEAKERQTFVAGMQSVAQSGVNAINKPDDILRFAMALTGAKEMVEAAR